MRVELWEAEAAIKGKNSYLTWVCKSSRVLEPRLVRHLHKAVSRYTALLAHLPENRLLVVVYLPDPLQDIGDDSFCSLWALELNSLAEAEVRHVVCESLEVVEC